MSDAVSDAIRDAAHLAADDPAKAGRPASGGATGRPHGTFLVHTAADLRALRGAEPRAGDAGSDGSGDGTGRQRAVVMTMGALHEGHAALVAAAREHVGWSGQVVVTVFVNPLQFGPSEDLGRYPRTLDADLLVAERVGADVVFAPDVDEVYPGGDPQVRIAAGPVGDRLEGASRPGHFDGMLTVVAKLLHLTAPDVAFFGQKDAQQLALVRRMAEDLNFPVGIVAVPTHREPDGMARSSRNRYLSPAERGSAAELRRALLTAEQAVRSGPRAVVRAARAILDNEQLDPPVETDYVALVDPSDFTEVPDTYEGEALLAVAARVGTTRLIDNIPLHLSATGGADGGVTG